jgi:hypothetical protein
MITEIQKQIDLIVKANGGAEEVKNEKTNKPKLIPVTLGKFGRDIGKREQFHKCLQQSLIRIKTYHQS